MPKTEKKEKGGLARYCPAMLILNIWLCIPRLQLCVWCCPQLSSGMLSLRASLMGTCSSHRENSHLPCAHAERLTCSRNEASASEFSPLPKGEEGGEGLLPVLVFATQGVPRLYVSGPGFPSWVAPTPGYTMPERDCIFSPAEEGKRKRGHSSCCRLSCRSCGGGGKTEISRFRIQKWVPSNHHRHRHLGVQLPLLPR